MELSKDTEFWKQKQVDHLIIPIWLISAKKDPSTAMSQFRAFKELSKSSSHIENHAFKVVHQRENLSNALNTMTSMGIRVNNFSVEGSFGGIFSKSSLPNRSDGRKYKSCHGLVMEAVEIFWKYSERGSGEIKIDVFQKCGVQSCGKQGTVLFLEHWRSYHNSPEIPPQIKQLKSVEKPKQRFWSTERKGWIFSSWLTLLISILLKLKSKRNYLNLK